MRKRCLAMVSALAKQDERVVFIGSDLAPGILADMKAEFPDRHFMEGVSEQHIIGMAAGLAKNGYIPYVNTIATFITRRCYEQIAIDAALQRLPLRLIGSSGGLVHAPLGPTHLAIEDIALMRAIPNMSVVAVCDADEMTRLMQATLDWPDPLYIRLAKGSDAVVSSDAHEFQIGKAVLMRRGRSREALLLVSTGIMTQRALQAAAQLESDGFDVSVLHMHTVKPLDHVALAFHASRARAVITIEEHVRNGGLGSAIIESLSDQEIFQVPVHRLALPDAFPHQYGSQNDQLRALGLDADGIAQAVRAFCDRRRPAESVSYA